MTSSLRNCSSVLNIKMFESVGCVIEEAEAGVFDETVDDRPSQLEPSS